MVLCSFPNLMENSYFVLSKSTVFFMQLPPSQVYSMIIRINTANHSTKYLLNFIHSYEFIKTFRNNQCDFPHICSLNFLSFL